MYVAQASQCVAQCPAFAEGKLERCNFISCFLETLDGMIEEGGMVIVVSGSGGFGLWYI